MYVGEAAGGAYCLRCCSFFSPASPRPTSVPTRGNSHGSSTTTMPALPPVSPPNVCFQPPFAYGGSGRWKSWEWIQNRCPSAASTPFVRFVRCGLWVFLADIRRTFAFANFLCRTRTDANEFQIGCPQEELTRELGSRLTERMVLHIVVETIGPHFHVIFISHL